MFTISVNHVVDCIEPRNNHMPVPDTIPAILIAVVATIAVFFIKYRSGRVVGKARILFAVALIVTGGLALAVYEFRAEWNAQAMVASMFGLPKDAEPLAFDRGASKGRRIQRLEAIYQLSDEREPSVSLGHTSFHFKKSSSISEFRNWLIDDFRTYEDALAWRDLAQLTDQTGWVPQRGRLSRQQTPDNASISGLYLCAFIPVISETADADVAQDVVPCHAIDQPVPPGITVFAVQNRSDDTLHVLIE